MDFFLGRGEGPLRRDPSRKYFVLLDVQLAADHGVDVLRQIKAHAQLRTIPVFMLTSREDPELVERCHRLGCNGYIQKPSDFRDFSDAVHHLGFLLSVMLLLPASDRLTPPAG